MSNPVFLCPTFGVGYQSFLPNGTVNSQGFINTYAAGSSTPLATYTTVTGTIANPTQIPLGSSGLPPNEIWLMVNSSYKIVVCDATNTPIPGQTYDNVPGSTTDASVVTYTPPGTGAVPTTVGAKLGQFTTLQDWGGVGDGTTDNHAAFNLASTALGSTGFFELRPGVYYVASNTTISPSTIFYAGSKIKPASGVTVTLTQPFFALDTIQLFDLSAGGTIVVSLAQPYLTPQMFGALANGVNDDTNALKQSLAACTAATCSWHFPDATGHYMAKTLSSAFLIVPGVGITADGAASIDGGGTASSDCLQFTPGNYTAARYNLPSISNFVGKAIVMKGNANLISANIQTIGNCSWGISLETDAVNNFIGDNTVEFDSIATCGSGSTGGGIQLLAFNASSVMQGHLFRGAFVNGCINSIQFNTSAVSIPAWNTNVFDITAIDGDNIANTTGITAPTHGFVGNVFRIPGFFGGFAGAYISMPDGGNNTFQLGFDAIASYAKIVCNGNGQFIQNTNGNSQGNRSTPIAAAQTASNNRAAFNGGTPVFATSFTVSFATSNLGAGATQDFYVYSPFTDGYSDKFWLQMHNAGANTGWVPVCVEDASVIAGIDGNTVANQIHIRMTTITAQAATTCNGTIHMRTT